MTDLKLNKEIMALIKNWKGATITNTENPNAIGYTEPLFIQGSRMGCSTFFVDYCNNWSDLMPLVVEHKILEESVVYPNEKGPGHMVEYWVPDVPIQFKSERLQRALAECLLEVLRAKIREQLKR